MSQVYQIRVKLLKSFFIVISACSFLFTLNAKADDTVRIYNAGWVDNMQKHQQRVIKKIFEITEDSYGKTYLSYPEGHLSEEQRRNKIKNGEEIQIGISTVTLTDEQKNEGVTQIRVPLFNRLLGVRQFISHKKNLGPLSSIDTIDKFLNFKAGLGLGWGDVNILRKAGVTVVESLSYDSLFNMLDDSNVDYIPLSVLEVQNAQMNQPVPDVPTTIVHNTYLYYSIPIYLDISSNRPELIDRINLGLERLAQNKGLVKMFDSSFANEIRALQPSSASVYVIANPELSVEENWNDLKYILDTYFTSTTVVHRVN